MKLLLGDIRNELHNDLLRNIERIIEQRQDKPSYWILVYQNRENLSGQETKGQERPGWTQYIEGTDLINTKIILLSQKPPKMVGTMCWHVDNRRGKLVREWILPLDRPRDEQFVSGEGAKEVFDSAEGVPIIW